jgi:hypothetical protein
MKGPENNRSIIRLIFKNIFGHHKQVQAERKIEADTNVDPHWGEMNHRRIAID